MNLQNQKKANTHTAEKATAKPADDMSKAAKKLFGKVQLKVNDDITVQKQIFSDKSTNYCQKLNKLIKYYKSKKNADSFYYRGLLLFLNS